MTGLPPSIADLAMLQPGRFTGQPAETLTNAHCVTTATATPPAEQFNEAITAERPVILETVRLAAAPDD